MPRIRHGQTGLAEGTQAVDSLAHMLVNGVAHGELINDGERQGNIAVPCIARNRRAKPVLDLQDNHARVVLDALQAFDQIRECSK